MRTDYEKPILSIVEFNEDIVTTSREEVGSGDKWDLTEF